MHEIPNQPAKHVPLGVPRLILIDAVNPAAARLPLDDQTAHDVERGGANMPLRAGKMRRHIANRDRVVVLDIAKNLKLSLANFDFSQRNSILTTTVVNIGVTTNVVNNKTGVGRFAAAKGISPFSQ